MAGVATVRAGATTGEVASEEATWGMVRLAAEAKAEAVLCVAEPVREMEAKAEKAKAAVVQVEVALVAAEMGAAAMAGVATAVGAATAAGTGHIRCSWPIHICCPTRPGYQHTTRRTRLRSR